jgi:hypothetical protein
MKFPFVLLLSDKSPKKTLVCKAMHRFGRCCRIMIVYSNDSIQAIAGLICPEMAGTLWKQVVSS